MTRAPLPPKGAREFERIIDPVTGKEKLVPIAKTKEQVLMDMAIYGSAYIRRLPKRRKT